MTGNEAALQALRDRIESWGNSPPVALAARLMEVTGRNDAPVEPEGEPWDFREVRREGLAVQVERALSEPERIAAWRLMLVLPDDTPDRTVAEVKLGAGFGTVERLRAVLDDDFAFFKDDEDREGAVALRRMRWYQAFAIWMRGLLDAMGILLIELLDGRRVRVSEAQLSAYGAFVAQNPGVAWRLAHATVSRTAQGRAQSCAAVLRRIGVTRMGTYRLRAHGKRPKLPIFKADRWAVALAQRLGIVAPGPLLYMDTNIQQRAHPLPVAALCFDRAVLDVLAAVEADADAERRARALAYAYAVRAAVEADGIVTIPQRDAWTREPAGRLHVRGPSLQCCARALRPFVKPDSRQGKRLFLNLDFSAAHLRIAAALSGDPELNALLQADGDPYGLIARTLGMSREAAKEGILAALNGGADEIGLLRAFPRLGALCAAIEDEYRVTGGVTVLGVWRPADNERQARYLVWASIEAALLDLLIAEIDKSDVVRLLVPMFDGALCDCREIDAARADAFVRLACARIAPGMPVKVGTGATWAEAETNSKR